MSTKKTEPKNLRNFWLEVNNNGQQKAHFGPQARADRTEVKIFARNQGKSVEAVKVLMWEDEQGILHVTAYTADLRQQLEFTSER